MSALLQLGHWSPLKSSGEWVPVEEAVLGGRARGRGGGERKVRRGGGQPERFHDGVEARDVGGRRFRWIFVLWRERKEMAAESIMHVRSSSGWRVFERREDHYQKTEERIRVCAQQSLPLFTIHVRVELYLYFLLSSSALWRRHPVPVNWGSITYKNREFESK